MNEYQKLLAEVLVEAKQHVYTSPFTVGDTVTVRVPKLYPVPLTTPMVTEQYDDGWVYQSKTKSGVVV